MTVQKPSEGHAYLYFYGTEDDFYRYVEDFVEGDSLLLLIVGWFLAVICFGIAWLLRGRKASGNIFILCAASVVAQKQAYQQLNDVEKLRFWGLKIAAIPLEVGGFAAIWTHSDSTVWIAVGTVLLIFGVAAWMGSSASDENLEELEGNYVFNFDFRELIEAHKNTGADITAMYRKQEVPKERLSGGFIRYMKEAGSRLRSQSA